MFPGCPQGRVRAAVPGRCRDPLVSWPQVAARRADVRIPAEVAAVAAAHPFCGLGGRRLLVARVLRRPRGRLEFRQDRARGTRPLGRRPGARFRDRVPERGIQAAKLQRVEDGQQRGPAERGPGTDRGVAPRRQAERLVIGGDPGQQAVPVLFQEPRLDRRVDGLGVAAGGTGLGAGQELPVLFLGVERDRVRLLDEIVPDVQRETSRPPGDMPGPDKSRDRAWHLLRRRRSTRSATGVRRGPAGASRYWLFPWSDSRCCLTERP